MDIGQRPSETKAWIKTACWEIPVRQRLKRIKNTWRISSRFFIGGWGSRIKGDSSIEGKVLSNPGMKIDVKS